MKDSSEGQPFSFRKSVRSAKRLSSEILHAEQNHRPVVPQKMQAVTHLTPETLELGFSSDDVRAQLFRTALPKCAINSPYVASSGLNHDLLLVTSYYYCPKSAWPGKPPLHDVGPEYLVEVLANGQLHPLHVYAAPNGIRSPPVW